MRYLKLTIAYDGSGYHGWQIQADRATVQQTLEAAVERLTGHASRLVASGRTDAGVHATGQVAHFDTASQRSARGWLLGANSNLPDDIAVTWVADVPNDFHARFTALAVLLPELDRLFGIPQPARYHPEIDTGRHVLLALDEAARRERGPRVVFALLLHDLGKLETSRDVLYKAAELTNDEREQVRDHARRGVEIIAETTADACRRLTSSDLDEVSVILHVTC